MPCRRSTRLRTACLPALALAFNPTPALAHVKWFCSFDVAGSPVGLENVLCQGFEQLVLLAMAALLLGCVVEGTPLGLALLRSLDAATSLLRWHTGVVVRLVAAGFFLSLSFMDQLGMKHVLLTPELTTELPFVPWLQLAIAVSLLSRRTSALAAAGIAVLFAIAVGTYGVFHLMDYPIFLGLAAYLACIGLQRSPGNVRPVDLLRWSAAATLMWASIEKWAYPQWTGPVFVTHPGMNFGFDIDYFMQAAGVVEFTLAFALLWTPLVRRCAAVILGAMFVAAIGEFGLIDAIGHSCIVAVMLAVLADDARAPIRRWTIVLTPIGYSAALTVFLVAYYGLHGALFGSPIG